MKAVIGSLVAHLVYGALLGSIAGAVRMERRRMGKCCYQLLQLGGMR
jgi:hypothetical protein